MSVVTVKHRVEILHLETTFKTSKKDSSQRKRKKDGMYSNMWVGVIHVKYMSKDNNNNKKKQIKLKPGDPCSGKVTDVSFLCDESGKATLKCILPPCKQAIRGCDLRRLSVQLLCF